MGTSEEVEHLAPDFAVRAMVVDDVPENREVLSLMLGMIGCEVSLAENGRRALEAARQSRPDIIFMDIRLPGMSGLEVTRQVLAEFGANGPKIVATSASVLEHERGQLSRGGLPRFRGQAVSGRTHLRLPEKSIAGGVHL